MSSCQRDISCVVDHEECLLKIGFLSHRGYQEYSCPPPPLTGDVPHQRVPHQRVPHKREVSSEDRHSCIGMSIEENSHLIGGSPEDRFPHQVYC